MHPDRSSRTDDSTLDPWVPPENANTSNTWHATHVRYRVVAISVLMAFILYLDRICMGVVVKSDSFLADFNVERNHIGNVLGAFFFTYAIFQIPAGWASDRFGGRRMLTIYILAWSVLTCLTGWATSLVGLLIARLSFGVAQAGAYPTSGSIIRQWFPVTSRGRASSCIAMGGRMGGMFAPLFTAVLIASLGSWRYVLNLYGLLGMLVAAAYWLIVRDRPSEHPGTSDAERQFIGVPADTARATWTDILPMLLACCLHRPLWLCSLTQFAINIGWSFLVSWLPTYLAEKQVDPMTSAFTVSSILSLGVLGQPIGGWLCDLSITRFGMRWGRAFPIACSSTIACSAYLFCLGLDSVWAIVICCGLVAMMTDVGNPTIWAFIQDIGGRNTSAVYGWMNMWGNLGAALSAVLIPRLMDWGVNSGFGPNVVFALCGSAFLVAALAALGIDARQQILVPKSSTE